MNSIELKNVTKKFGKTIAVNDFSMEVGEGQTFGFLGPNGAGKTTTIRCIMDFIRPDSGEIVVLGKDAHKHSVEIKKDIGYLSGEIDLYDNWTGQKHLQFLRSLNGKNDISEKLVKMLNFDTSKKAKNLSSGNKQKLGLIMAFMFEPKLLILDEPTVGLDPILQNTVYELIEETAKRGATVFMSSHNLPEVERVCDKVTIIKDGKHITTESIATLKQKRLYTVKITLKEEIDPKTLMAESDELIRSYDNGIEYKIKSDINAFISKASEYNIKDIAINQAKLEDIFLEYYETDA